MKSPEQCKDQWDIILRGAMNIYVSTGGEISQLLHFSSFLQQGEGDGQEGENPLAKT